MFGYAAANHVICAVAEYPLEYRAGDKGREKLHEGMLSALRGLEARLIKSVNGEIPLGLKIPLNTEDVAYLVDEVFRGKSVVSGLTTRLALARWQKPSGEYGVEPMWQKEGQVFMKLDLKDLVCLTKEEAQRHEREILLGDKMPESLYEPEVLQVVAKSSRKSSRSANSGKDLP